LAIPYFGKAWRHAVIRAKETKVLERFLKSNRAEFMAVYGRRRVGKTFLIQSFFSKKNYVFFYATGIQKGTFLEQRTAFCSQISKIFYNGITLETPKNWFEVFELLDKSVNQIKNKKVVLFFDEFPWCTCFCE
jgi:AAA+ ATPase superfamily predicted ATPase